MTKIIAFDIINDITIIETLMGKKGTSLYNVRYGLQVKTYNELGDALEEFSHCQIHALSCAGHVVE